MKKNKRNKFKQGTSLVMAGALGVTGMMPAMLASAETGVTTASNATEATQILNALGIVAGRGDGDFHEQSNITRAEFTKIILYALGVDENILPSWQNQKVFSDVEPGAWYTGVINLAHHMGIVGGVGEGKYAPNKEVSHAEALTMIVNALGYKESTTKNLPWPANSIAKASELGIISSSTIQNSKVSAKRGEVFKYLVDALEVKAIGKTSTGLQAQGTTLLEKRLNSVGVTAQVLDIGGLNSSSLKSDEILVRGAFNKNSKNEETKKLKLNMEIGNIADIIFSDVQIIVNGNEINFLTVKEDNLKADIVEKVSGDTIYLKGNSKGYTVDKNADIVVDYAVVKRTSLTTIKPGAKVRYELDKRGVVRLVATNYNKPAIVEKVKDSTITLKNTSNLNLNKYKKIIVTLNGKTANTSSIKENDIIYSFKSGDNLIIEAHRNISKGKITRIDSSKEPTYIYVDSKKVDLSLSAMYSIDGGENILSAFDEDILGETVSIYKDANGEIILIVADIESSVGNFYVVDSVIKNVVENKELTNWVKLYDEDGRLRNYKLSSKISASSISENSFVAVAFDGDTITSIEKVTSTKAKLGKLKAVSLNGFKFEDNNFNPDNLTLRHGSKLYYIENQYVPVFYIEPNGTISVSTVKNLKKTSGEADLQILVDGNDIEYIFIQNGKELNVSKKEDSAILMDSYKAVQDGEKGLYFELSSGDSFFIKDNVSIVNAFAFRGYGDTSKSIEHITVGDIISYSLDAKDRISKLEEVNLTKDFDLHENLVTDVRANGVKIKDTWFAVTKKANIVDLSTANEVLHLTDTRDIEKGSRVAYSLNQAGEITAISIIASEADKTYVSTLINENKALDAFIKLDTNFKALEVKEDRTVAEIKDVKDEIVNTKTLVAKVETARIKADLTTKIAPMEIKVAEMEKAITETALLKDVIKEVVELEDTFKELPESTTVEQIEALKLKADQVEALVLKLKDSASKTTLLGRVEIVKAGLDNLLEPATPPAPPIEP